MSFGGGAEGDHSDKLPGIKKFVSQDELDEKRKERQDEWERVRKPEDPVERPEEEYDNRTLFDKLQDQKQRKQDDIDEQHKLRHQVRGLHDDEAKFLDEVSSQQEEISRRREEEDSQVLQEYQNAKTTASEESKQQVFKKQQPASSSKKSQLSLLAGAVKRKSVDVAVEEPGVKKTKSEGSSVSTTDERSSSLAADSCPKPPILQPPIARVIGILPGLGAYKDSSDSDSSSSDSDVEIISDTCPQKIIIQRVQQ